MEQEDERQERVRPPATNAPRRSRRMPIRGVLVAIDAPSIADQPWVVDAVDINADGLGLVLPPDLAPGTEVLITFKLDEGAAFARVPARVGHRLGNTGGMIFGAWTDLERLRLLEYLVRFWESPPAGAD